MHSRSPSTRSRGTTTRCSTAKGAGRPRRSQPTNPALAFEDTVQRHYEALRRLGLGVDVINPVRSPSLYRVVVAPSLAVLDPAVAESLRAYVEAGGLLVLGPHTGVRDRCNVT